MTLQVEIFLACQSSRSQHQFSCANLVFMCQPDVDDESEEIYVTLDADDDSDNHEHIDEDYYGQYVELCFTAEMANIILKEHQSLHPGEQATLRVYLSNDVKRSVVVKEDDLLTRSRRGETKEAHAAGRSLTLQCRAAPSCLAPEDQL